MNDNSLYTLCYIRKINKKLHKILSHLLDPDQIVIIDELINRDRTVLEEIRELQTRAAPECHNQLGVSLFHFM